MEEPNQSRERDGPLGHVAFPGFPWIRHMLDSSSLINNIWNSVTLILILIQRFLKHSARYRSHSHWENMDKTTLMKQLKPLAVVERLLDWEPLHYSANLVSLS